MTGCMSPGGFLACFCGYCGFLPQSISTRLSYTFGLLLSTILAIILKVRGSSLFSIAATAECDGVCWNYLAVYRISLALVIYHGFLSLFMIGVSSSADPRSFLQNAFWPLKAVIFTSILVGMFYIPNERLYSYWITSIVFSAFYVIFQSMLLIAFARGLAESWVKNYESSDSPGFWQFLLIGTTFLCFATVIVATVLLSVYYTGSNDCRFNHLFITFNWFTAIVAAVFSISPKVLEANPESGGILPAAMLALYNTYLTATAVQQNPALCSPFQSSTPGSGGNGLVLFLQILALCFTLFDLSSSAFSTSVAGVGYGINSEDRDDEEDQTQYNYSLFHLVFVLTSFYMASILTNWNSLYNGTGNLITVGTGQAVMWVTAGTSWLNTLLYLWTLIAPILFPDRVF